MLIFVDNIVNKQMVQKISLDTRSKQFTGNTGEGYRSVICRVARSAFLKSRSN